MRYGVGSYVGFGEISGYTNNGAAGDITHWWRIEPDSVRLKLETAPLKFQPLDSYSDHIAGMSDGQRWVKGTISFPLTYNSTQNLFRFITGHNKTPAPDTTWFHYDFVPVDPHNAANWVFGSTERHYCIELHRGDSAGNSIFYQGCMITGASFSCEPGSIVQITLEFLGRGYTVGAKSTPSFAARYMRTANNMLTRSYDLGSLTPAAAPSFSMNSIPYRLHRATFEVRTPLEHRWSIGDRTPTVQPKPSAARECLIDAEIDLPDTDALWQYWQANRVGDVSVMNATIFVSQSLPIDAIWALTEAVILPGTQVVEMGHGVLRAQMKLRGHSLLNTMAYVIGVRNQESNYK